MNTITAVSPATETRTGEPDPITVEVLRSRLEAIGREAGMAVERTAISPVVSETKDYSVTILDRDGGLVAGTGYITGHFGGSVNAVRATLARHGATIARGDVFLANDPHNGGGLHPNDVIVQRPAFVGDELVGWVAVSAHMMDVGGMTPGSLSPKATECYQEALRFPPVRLLRKGEEQDDTWAILRNNIRSAALVEADMRALVVGCNVAVEKIEDVVGELGQAKFAAALAALERAAEAALHRRIEAIADGTYRACGWLELGEEAVYPVPCKLTVTGSRMVFDFEGCPPQLPSYFNTKPYIVQTSLASRLHPWLAPDLPYSQAFLDLMDVRCPPRTLLNSEPPAPIGAAHMDATGAALSAASQCLLLALGASPDAPERRLMSAPAAIGWAMMTWSFEREGQAPASFIHTDGVFGGSPAGDDRDGIDLSTALVGTQSSFELSDVEILEAAYPILIEERNTARGDHGLGAYRSGSASHEILRPHGVDRLTGYMISTCGSVPNPGMAGGGPGTRSRLRLLRGDGGSEEVPLQAMGVPLTDGDRFELQGPTGGGFGDPLWRPAELVANDVRRGRISAEQAEQFYAVDCSDAVRTERLRSERRAERLRKAAPPARPAPAGTRPSADAVPLFPGIVQVGPLAIAEASGAVLAEAPYPWTDGCCTLDEENVGANGYVVRTRSYLDPVSGRRLHHEILQPDGTSLFECSPDRWTGRNSSDV